MTWAHSHSKRYEEQTPGFMSNDDRVFVDKSELIEPVAIAHVHIGRISGSRHVSTMGEREPVDTFAGVHNRKPPS